MGRGVRNLKLACSLCKEYQNALMLQNMNGNMEEVSSVEIRALKGKHRQILTLLYHDPMTLWCLQVSIGSMRKKLRLKKL